MKTTIVCALLVLLLFVLFMGRAEISLSPFYIRIPGWQNVVGWLLLLIGVWLLNNEAKRQAYEDGFDDGITYVKEKFEVYLERKEEKK